MRYANIKIGMWNEVCQLTHEEKTKGRLEDGNCFCLCRTKIGKSAVKKNAFMLMVEWWNPCLMYMDCKGSKVGVCVSVWNFCCFWLVGNKRGHCSMFTRSHKYLVFTIWLFLLPLKWSLIFLKGLSIWATSLQQGLNSKVPCERVCFLFCIVVG